MAIIVAVAAALLLWLGVASSDSAITAVAFVALHIAIAVLLQGAGCELLLAVCRLSVFPKIRFSQLARLDTSSGIGCARFSADCSRIVGMFS